MQNKNVVNVNDGKMIGNIIDIDKRLVKRNKDGYAVHRYVCEDGISHKIGEHVAKWEYFNGESLSARKSDATIFIVDFESPSSIVNSADCVPKRDVPRVIKVAFVSPSHVEPIETGTWAFRCMCFLESSSEETMKSEK